MALPLLIARRKGDKFLPFELDKQYYDIANARIDEIS